MCCILRVACSTVGRRRVRVALHVLYADEGRSGTRGDRGNARYSSETEGFNHAALAFEERSRELCLSSIALRSRADGSARVDSRRDFIKARHRKRFRIPENDELVRERGVHKEATDDSIVRHNCEVLLNISPRRLRESIGCTRREVELERWAASGTRDWCRPFDIRFGEKWNRFEKVRFAARSRHQE